LNISSQQVIFECFSFNDEISGTNVNKDIDDLERLVTETQRLSESLSANQNNIVTFAVAEFYVVFTIQFQRNFQQTQDDVVRKLL
jgi:hypothetical protein